VERPADWFDPLPAPPPAPPPPAPAAGAPGLRHDPRARLAAAVLLAVLAFCLAGPLRAPYAAVHLGAAYRPPSAAHWFGTDALGRDVFARTAMGGRISLGVGALAAALDLGVGAVVGAAAGWAGGAVDAALMRAVDVLYGVPFLLVAILLLAVLGPGLGPVVLGIALVNWLGMARLVRGEVRRLRAEPFVLAARALGLPGPAIVRRHVLPALAGPVLAWLAFNVPSAIFLEAFLSYLGLGVQPPMPSWGSLIADGAATFPLHPWIFAFPAAILCLTMAALYLGADALQDALDPRRAP
jgi:oligopeptide transport system permease protein